MTALPPASNAELAISKQLQNYILQQITESGGWIPFSRYMQLALYTPQLGYYNNFRAKFGTYGDFVTAPELTPIFTQTVARQIAELLPHCDSSIYEFGAGSGIFAADLLMELNKLGVKIKAYKIIELSADLIHQQQKQIAEKNPAFLSKVSWLNSLPEQIDGVLIGNELLDAMPCELIHWHENKIWQRGVSASKGQFIWRDCEIKNTHLLNLAKQIKPDSEYLSEINLIHNAFINSISIRLKRGALIFFDYGFPTHEYYHPQRKTGTLIGHYRQHSIHDPFFMPGIIDLTSHVNFSAIAESGISASLDLIGYTSQAQFLINCDITDILANSAAIDSQQYFYNANNVQKLLSSAEMGELFKVIGFARQMPLEWIGFLDADRCHTL